MTSEHDQSKFKFGKILGDVNIIVGGSSNTIGPKTSGQSDSGRPAAQPVQQDTAGPEEADTPGIIRRVLGWLARIVRLIGSIIKGALTAVLGAHCKAIFG